MRRPKLTIGMACRDDFDGVYFTITSLMTHHAEAMSDCEIVVVDNNPGSAQGRLVRQWISSHVPMAKYYRFAGHAGTAQPRNEVFRRAAGTAVLCLDCHVLLAPGAVDALIAYYESHEDCNDLLTGPLISDAGTVVATHQDPIWRNDAWGIWALDERGKDPQSEPFEIWQQGMGLFSSRKESWVGFHPEFRGFGGCESYIMEKVRRNGNRVLCCPWLRWTHRFSRQGGAPYPVNRHDRIRNYLIGFRELGLPTAPVLDHFGVPSEEIIDRPPPLKKTTAGETRVAVVGSDSFAGVRMRGRLLARHLFCEVVTPSRLPDMARREIVVAIKKGFDPALLRAKSDRLIYDPLDAFASERHPVRPVDYWQSEYERIGFDDILATSPACYDRMREALPNPVAVHLVPHQCDRRIRLNWHDPKGPVVYAGLERFVHSGIDRIQKACRKIGRRLLLSNTCDGLRGASLVLALRLPPYDTELNRCCKPQIKLENAVAGGIPVVATDCPASVSLHPDIETVPVDFTPAMLAEAMRRALDRPGPFDPYTDDRYLGAMDRLFEQPRKVVYTAVFGGYDELHEPRVRTPGVQYICFTDNPYLKTKTWTIRYCPPTADPMLQAKRIKILAHETLDCDVSLWIDGRVKLHDLNGLFDRCRADVAAPRHPYRTCIYEEAAFCQRVGRGDPARIATATARYRTMGHPENSGLWLGSVIFRKHSPETAAFNKEWWREVQSGTSRDQLSLAMLLRQQRFFSQTLPMDMPQYRLARHAHQW